MRQRDFRIVLALRRTENFAVIDQALDESDVLRAPTWPDLAMPFAKANGRRPSSFGDQFAFRIQHSPAVITCIINEWDELIAVSRPDAIIADFAPGCLMAARGSVPTVAVGDAFNLPPAQLEQFPNFDHEGLQPAFDERRTLEVVNEGLSACNRPALRHLPEIFSANRACVGAFAELDPYDGMRTNSISAPWMPHVGESSAGPPDEIFGYFGTRDFILPAALKSLALVAAKGIRVRVNIGGLQEDAAAFLATTGIVVEREPVPYEQIRARTRLAVSPGSYGFLCCGLAAGIPQVVLPPDLAKDCSARLIQKLGIGRCVRLQPNNPFEPALLAQIIINTFNNVEMQARARHLAPSFAARLELRPEEVVADMVEALIGRA